jgi:transcriptional regulator with XRE-family HTH domain
MGQLETKDSQVVSRFRKMTTAQQFADRLQAELDRKGWTAQDLVRAWGGSPMPYKWLKGRTAPRVDTKRRLADTLGIPMAAFGPTPANGHAAETPEAEMLTPPAAIVPTEPPIAEMDVVKRGPMPTLTVHLRVDAMVTPSVANAVMRALEDIHN